MVRAQVEPTAGSWKTWVIPSGRQMRTEPPPSAAATTGELVWLKSYLAEARQSPEAMKQMRYWTAGPPAYRWVDRMLNLIETRGFSNPKNARNLRLLNVAIYDATIAAWESKYAYNRQRPAVADQTIQTAIETPQSPSYPSEHAAAAGAASEILAYLYPADAQNFRYLGEEAARAALTAGINYPSDVIAGLQLGRAVGSRVVALAQNDGSQAVWTGTAPDGPGILGRGNAAGAACRNVENVGAHLRQPASPRSAGPIRFTAEARRTGRDQKLPADVRDKRAGILLPVS